MFNKPTTALAGFLLVSAFMCVPMAQALGFL